MLKNSIHTGIIQIVSACLLLFFVMQSIFEFGFLMDRLVSDVLAACTVLTTLYTSLVYVDARLKRKNR